MRARELFSEEVIERGFASDDIDTAIRYDSSEKLLELLKLYNYSVNSKLDSNVPLICYAAKTGSIKVVHALIRNGVDIHAEIDGIMMRRNTKANALTICCGAGVSGWQLPTKEEEFRRLVILRLLVAAGADINSFTSDIPVDSVMRWQLYWRGYRANSAFKLINQEIIYDHFFPSNLTELELISAMTALRREHPYEGTLLKLLILFRAKEVPLELMNAMKKCELIALKLYAQVFIGQAIRQAERYREKNINIDQSLILPMELRIAILGWVTGNDFNEIKRHEYIEEMGNTRPKVAMHKRFLAAARLQWNNIGLFGKKAEENAAIEIQQSRATPTLEKY